MILPAQTAKWLRKRSALRPRCESRVDSRIPLPYSVNALPPTFAAAETLGLAMYLGLLTTLAPLGSKSIAARFATFPVDFAAGALALSSPLSFFPPRTPAFPLKTRLLVMPCARLRSEGSSSMDSGSTSEMGERKSSSSVAKVGRERSMGRSGASGEGSWEEARLRLSDLAERWYLDCARAR